MTTLIDNSSSLQHMLQVIESGDKILGLDTEFLRYGKYYPQLCVIQIQSGTDTFIIDTLSGINMEPIKQILSSTDYLKIIHDASQDLAVIKHDLDIQIRNIFDTQIGTMFCGENNRISYEDAVRVYTGHIIVKQTMFKHWNKRPLTEEQLKYASADVKHLKDIYQTISQILTQENKMEWMQEEMESLEIRNKDHTETTPPEEAWKKIPITEGTYLNTEVLKIIAQWREQCAQKRNLPRSYIATDSTLCKIASAPAQKVYKAISLNIPTHKMQKEIYALLTNTVINEEDYRHKYNTIPNNMPSKKLMKQMQQIVHQKCNKYNVSVQLTASNKELVRLALNQEASKISRGWRNKVVGRQLGVLLSQKNNEYQRYGSDA